MGVIFCYAVDVLIVSFDDRFWSDARVSYQIECCRIEVKSFRLFLLMLVGQMWPE